MNRLIRTAQALQSVLESHALRFCFIGGFAVQVHGEPRVTRDVDVSVLTGLGGERFVIDTLLAAFAPRRPDADAFALQARVLLLQSDDNIGIDVTLSALPFEAEIIERATAQEFAPGVFLKTCSAEDLIVMKTFAGRSIDWRDVEMILRRNRGRLDIEYIFSRAKPLIEAKEEPELLAELERLVKRFA